MRPYIRSQRAATALTAFLLVISLPATRGWSDDWPQWMGPTRDGEYRETGLLERFPTDGAKIIWRQPIAGGYAGPAVSQGKVLVSDFVKAAGDSTNDPGLRAQSSGKERVSCFDERTGELLWRHEYPCDYAISYPAGPRCTPTVAGNDVFTLGSEGDFKCLDLLTGDVRWAVNFKRDFGAETPMWGFSAHPLVVGDQVISMVGGAGQTVMAFDRATGKVRWKGVDASAVGYCPPSLIEAGGVEQLLIWDADALRGMNPINGETYWTVPLKPQYEMSICRPQLDGDLLYASGIGSQAVLVRLLEDRPGATELWRGEAKNAVYCGNSTPLFVNGVIYGSDCQVGCLRAVNAADGERLWETFAATRQGETRRLSHGTAFITHLAGTDRYLLFSELGDLIIAQLTADGYRELSRAHVIEPTGDAFGRPVVWTHPAYANRVAYIRNDKEIVAVSLQGE